MKMMSICCKALLLLCVLATGALAADSTGYIRNCVNPKTYPADNSKLQPETFDAPISDLRWAAGPGHNDVDKYVLAITEPGVDTLGGKVYRSEDFGKPGSWFDVTDHLHGATEREYAKDPSLAGVVDVLFQEAHPEKMLFMGAALHHWVSTDYGHSFTKVPTPGNTLGFYAEIKLHPTQPDWVLSKVRRLECEGLLAFTNKWCAYDLFVSKDFAKTWVNLTEASGGAIASFEDFDWGATMRHGDANSVTDETILATAYERTDDMKGPYPGWDKDKHFVVSDDLFRSQHRKLVSCGNQFEIIGRKVFLAMPSDCPTNWDGSKRDVPQGASSRSVTLLVSRNEGRSFHEVCTPAPFLDRSYNLIRTHDGSGAFLVVDHQEQLRVEAHAPMGNLYSPGWNSSLYSMSMRRNYRKEYIPDVGRVEGLPGVYLANQLGEQALAQPGALAPRYEKFVQTKVSFDNGARWQALTLPTRFRHGGCNRCDPAGERPCALHLHGPSSWHDGPEGRPSAYSHENAPGIIMAVGNTGEYLETAADALCTWLSRDGGLSWEDVADSPYIYEYGDHGALMVMTQHETHGPADRLLFSQDEGACWHTVQLREAIDVQNIRVEGSLASHVFVVHGKACQASSAHPTCTHDSAGREPKGKAYIVDLRPLLGGDWRDCGEGDYELWSAPMPSLCLTGFNITMERRRREKDCFNGKEFERSKTTMVPCTCSANDIECEYGYERGPDGECTAIEGIDVGRCPDIKAGKYHPSASHQRLVSNDRCKGLGSIIKDTDGRGHLKGWRPWRHRDDEEEGGRGHFWKHLLVAGLVLAGLAALFGAWWRFLASDRQRDTLEEVWAPVGGAVQSVGRWAWDGVQGLWDRCRGRNRAAGDAAREAFFQPLGGGEDELGLEDLAQPSPRVIPNEP